MRYPAPPQKRKRKFSRKKGDLRPASELFRLHRLRGLSHYIQLVHQISQDQITCVDLPKILDYAGKTMDEFERDVLEAKRLRLLPPLCEPDENLSAVSSFG
jgi:hypothetical protein